MMMFITERMRTHHKVSHNSIDALFVDIRITGAAA